MCVYAYTKRLDVHTLLVERHVLNLPLVLGQDSSSGVHFQGLGKLAPQVADLPPDRPKCVDSGEKKTQRVEWW